MPLPAYGVLVGTFSHLTRDDPTPAGVYSHGTLHVDTPAGQYEGAVDDLSLTVHDGEWKVYGIQVAAATDEEPEARP